MLHQPHLVPRRDKHLTGPRITEPPRRGISLPLVVDKLSRFAPLAVDQRCGRRSLGLKKRAVLWAREGRFWRRKLPGAYTLAYPLSRIPRAFPGPGGTKLPG